MRVAFMGTPAFAVPSLSALAAEHDVVAVYSRPDKPSGRGRVPAPTPVKAAAQGLGLPVVQPPTLRDPAEAEMLAAFRPDVLCVAAYGMILPDEFLAVPAMGAVNVHASLLPAYRGAAPIQRAILNGEAVTGVSIMRVVSELDAGPYAAQVTVPVGDADAERLTSVLAEVGAEALIAVLDEMERGTVVWVAQNDADATYAPKVTAEDVALDPALRAEDALRRVRASTASAPSRMRLADRNLVVLAAGPSDVRLAPGEVGVAPEGLHIGFSSGSLRLDRVKPEGRAGMEAAAFARGARLAHDARWGRWE